MPEDQTLVSVIVPAYNGQETILDTLTSIVEQRHRPIQLIVVDDASKDSTRLKVEEFFRENGILQWSSLIEHSANLGLAKSLNDAINRSSAEYLLILHQDCKLLSDDWIDQALLIMADERIAVVTGYYGIPDSKHDNFMKRTFGVLRRQFHSPSGPTREEASFSEGKCDVYRRNLLMKLGGFPQSYKIAGEDLIVSYTLRRAGYKIVKSYVLPVEQRFTGTADSLTGNIKKEFIFGKAMGGVFAEFKFFVFRGLKTSAYSRSRSLHRASQPIFAVTILILATFAAVFSSFYLYVILALVIARYLYYLWRLSRELRSYPGNVKHPFLEPVFGGLLGIATDFIYFIGFIYGLIRRGLRLNL